MSKNNRKELFFTKLQEWASRGGAKSSNITYSIDYIKHEECMKAFDLSATWVSRKLKGTYRVHPTNTHLLLNKIKCQLGQESRDTENVIIVDDASFSGSKVISIMKSLLETNKGGQIKNIFVAIPFMSEYAIEKLNDLLKDHDNKVTKKGSMSRGIEYKASGVQIYINPVQKRNVIHGARELLSSFGLDSYSLINSRTKITIIDYDRSSRSDKCDSTIHH